MRFLKNSHEEYVLLSDCDTVANIDYRDVFKFHSEKEADITVVYRHGMSPDSDKNCLYTVDPEGVIRDMLVKRGSDADCNYGIGMSIIGREKLMELVEDCMARNLYDFDRDLLQRCLPDMRVCGYEFTGAAYQVTSFGSYFNANMALMDRRCAHSCSSPPGRFIPKCATICRAKYGLGSQISNSIVADGCIIDGEVENCVLFRGVKVKKGREAEKLCDYAGHRSGGEYPPRLCGGG